MERPVAVVLVVDDDARDRAMAASMLKHCGYGVVAAHDAADAWETFRAHSADISLILIDAELPRVAGVSLSESIRLISPSVPIMLMTRSNGDVNDIDPSAARLGIITVLQKPLQQHEAGRIIRQVLDARDKVAAAALSWSNAHPSLAHAPAGAPKVAAPQPPLPAPSGRMAAAAGAGAGAGAAAGAARARTTQAAAPAPPPVPAKSFHWPPTPEDLASMQVIDARTFQPISVPADVFDGSLLEKVKLTPPAPFDRPMDLRGPDLGAPAAPAERSAPATPMFAPPPLATAASPAVAPETAPSTSAATPEPELKLDHAQAFAPETTVPATPVVRRHPFPRARLDRLSAAVTITLASVGLTTYLELRVPEVAPTSLIISTNDVRLPPPVSRPSLPIPSLPSNEPSVSTEANLATHPGLAARVDDVVSAVERKTAQTAAEAKHEPARTPDRIVAKGPAPAPVSVPDQSRDKIRDRALSATATANARQREAARVTQPMTLTHLAPSSAAPSNAVASSLKPASTPAPKSVPESAPTSAPPAATMPAWTSMLSSPKMPPADSVTSTASNPASNPAPAPTRNLNPSAGAVAATHPAESRTPDRVLDRPAEVTAAPAVMANGPADADLIYSTLSRYRTAYQHLDVEATRAVYPTVDTRALARAFGGLREQNVVFHRCNVVAVKDTDATAVCRGEATYVTRVGSSTPRTMEHEWTFKLKKMNGGWTIANATAVR